MFVGACVYMCHKTASKKKDHENEREHPCDWEPIRGKFVQLNEQHQGDSLPLTILTSLSFSVSPRSSNRTLKVMKPHNWICILPAILLMENLLFSFSFIPFERWQCHCDYHRKMAQKYTYTHTHAHVDILFLTYSHSTHCGLCFLQHLRLSRVRFPFPSLILLLFSFCTATDVVNRGLSFHEHSKLSRNLRKNIILHIVIIITNTVRIVVGGYRTVRCNAYP